MSPSKAPSVDANSSSNDDTFPSQASVEATSPYQTTNDVSLELRESVLVAYRSVGIGTFGVVMRFVGMPLEKIALFMNSSQVSGSNQLRQSVKLAFKGGPLAPYRVVGPASLVAWFMQYSVMGFAFQFVDRVLSKTLNVQPVCYGDDLMKPPPSAAVGSSQENVDSTYHLRSTLKTVVAPILAGSLESAVANRAEVQRYFGPTKFASIESKLGWSPLARLCAPAYSANVMRNVIMCHTSFIITPITYKLYFPQEEKSKCSLFWYGMGMNFAGNAVAITQQALWGRALDYCAENGGRNIRYSEVIRSSLKKDGRAAFFTLPKWCSRIMMNAPVQGSLPWFYNNILPLGESRALSLIQWATKKSLSKDRGYQRNDENKSFSLQQAK